MALVQGIRLWIAKNILGIALAMALAQGITLGIAKTQGISWRRQGKKVTFFSSPWKFLQIPTNPPHTTPFSPWRWPTGSSPRGPPLCHCQPPGNSLWGPPRPGLSTLSESGKSWPNMATSSCPIPTCGPPPSVSTAAPRSWRGKGPYWWLNTGLICWPSHHSGLPGGGSPLRDPRPPDLGK